MERYTGKDEELKALSETNISDSAFGIVVEIGYKEMKELLEKNPYDVLCSYFDIWFERCPELKDAAVLWIESSYDCKSITDGVIERKLLKRIDFRDLCMVIARVRVKACRTIPYFLRCFFEAILNESAVLYCNTTPLYDLCRNYFAEIEEFMAYAEED
ncbi:hypothetical protein IKF92_02890 [Candidatus Saccharibacteria bacterium]|nr:hypothetical protein [Candidatus Saccharibacteria bacterium]